MKTAWSVLSSAIATLTLALGLNFCSAGEPTYRGKSASYWLDSWGTNMEGSDAAFKAMGTNVVPFLIKLLEQKPSKLGEVLDKKLADYSLSHPGRIPEEVTEILPSAYRVEQRREMAAFFLGELGPLAEAAIPTLFRIYCDT